MRHPGRASGPPNESGMSRLSEVCSPGRALARPGLASAPDLGCPSLTGGGAEVTVPVFRDRHRELVEPRAAEPPFPGLTVRGTPGPLAPPAH